MAREYSDMNYNREQIHNETERLKTESQNMENGEVVATLEGKDELLQSVNNMIQRLRELQVEIERMPNSNPSKANRMNFIRTQIGKMYDTQKRVQNIEVKEQDSSSEIVEGEVQEEQRVPEMDKHKPREYNNMRFATGWIQKETEILKDASVNMRDGKITATEDSKDVLMTSVDNLIKKLQEYQKQIEKMPNDNRKKSNLRFLSIQIGQMYDTKKRVESIELQNEKTDPSEDVSNNNAVQEKQEQPNVESRDNGAVEQEKMYEAENTPKGAPKKQSYAHINPAIDQLRKEARYMYNRANNSETISKAEKDDLLRRFGELKEEINELLIGRKRGAHDTQSLKESEKRIDDIVKELNGRVPVKNDTTRNNPAERTTGNATAGRTAGNDPAGKSTRDGSSANPLSSPKFARNNSTEGKLKITYWGSKNNYVITDSNGTVSEISAIKFKNTKEKMEYIKNSPEGAKLLQMFGSEKNMKKMVKKMDPQLMTILAGKGDKYIQGYINEFSKGKNKANKGNLPYEMTYNLNGMRKNKDKNGLSFLQRFRTNRMAKANEHVAEYKPDTKDRRWLAIPVVGALAAGVFGLTRGDEDPIPEPQQNPTIDSMDDRAPIPPVPPNVREESQDIPGKIQDIPQLDDNTLENGTSPSVTAFTLGSKVNLADGTKYTENSMQGGDKGKLGQNSWSYADSYTVDRAAFYNDGNLIGTINDAGLDVKLEIQKKANELGISESDINTIYHICVGDGHVAPLGWIDPASMSSEDIEKAVSKTYEELQSAKKSTEKVEANFQEKNGDER